MVEEPVRQGQHAHPKALVERPRLCRFRFQYETREFSRGIFGFNWDWNAASVPIESENPVRSGENGLSFQRVFPALHILVGD
jgi:hypothetical protein